MDAARAQLVAYPKSLVCRASSEAERDEWIRAIMSPLEQVGISLTSTREEKK